MIRTYQTKPLTDAPADLSVFNLTDPNGQWKLYVVDDAGTDTGTISGGWLLLLTVPTIFTVNSTADPGVGVRRHGMHLARGDKRGDCIRGAIRAANARI